MMVWEAVGGVLSTAELTCVFESEGVKAHWDCAITLIGCSTRKYRDRDRDRDHDHDHDRDRDSNAGPSPIKVQQRCSPRNGAQRCSPRGIMMPSSENHARQPH
eukprot:3568210-Rhodomonas_salina.2